MSEIKEYKCPACGGAVEFNSAGQNMKCPYCDTEYDLSFFENAPDPGEADQNLKAQCDENWDPQDTDHIKIYICESCGGEIIATELTGASACPFCNNRIVMKEQFSGDLKPNYIIPFKLDKKAAKHAYFNHLEGKKYLPKVFKDENHIDEIQGIYVPFWLYDFKVDATIQYDAQKIRVWVTKNIEYTETRFYRVQRSGQLEYAHVPFDASKKMDNALMESIEPFDFNDAVPFQTAYLAGYMADRYDVNHDEGIVRAKERAQKETAALFDESVNGYHLKQTRQQAIHFPDTSYAYALFPVWILNTTWNGEKYTFAMNGQTGKMTGDLPVDQSAFRKTVLLRGIILGVIFYIISLIINFF